jgi:hypothetical protein
VRHAWTGQQSVADGSVQSQCRRCRVTRWRKFEGAVCITSWRRPSHKERSYGAIPECRLIVGKKRSAA